MDKCTTEQYIKMILHKLKCSSKKKKEIEKELKSDIQVAMENGESWEAVRERMGTPEEIAREFNSNFTQSELKAVKKKKYFCIAGAVVLLLSVIAVGAVYILPKGISQEKMGYDEDEVKERTKLVLSLLDSEDYDTIKNEYSSTIMKSTFEKNKIGKAKQTICDDFGKFLSYGNFYTQGLEQFGKKYVVVQVNASYENVSVTYTITFDKDMKIAGLYMK